jgi:hypothetical protein
MELDVGVPSSSKWKILQCLDWSSWLLVGAVGSIDLGPKWASIGVQTGLVGSDPLLVVLLSVIQNFTEHTDLLVPAGVIALHAAPPVG